MIKSIDLTNEQRFIDININSDSEDSTDKSEPNKDKTFLFKFKKNNKHETETNIGNKLFATTPATSINNSLTLNEATDILLSNLNELNLHFYSDDDHEDDDDEDEEEEEENKANLIQLQQKLQRIETKEAETYFSTNEHISTPLKSKSICSDENMNEISLNSSSSNSSDSNNRTLSCLTDNNLNKKSSFTTNKDILTRCVYIFVIKNHK